MAASRKTIREWVAKKMGRLHAVVIDSVDGGDSTLLNVESLSDISEDDERFMDSYLLLDDGSHPLPEWRRITAANLNAGQVSINRVFTDDPANDTPAWIYSLMNITEWNDAINEALTKLYFPDREVVDLRAVTTTDPANEYDVPTWVQTKGQFLGARYRNISTGRESPLPMWRMQESITGLKLVILDTVWSSTTYQLVMEGQRFHAKIDDDRYGTTCPQPLYECAVQVAAIHKVIAKYGDRFKKAYMQDLAIAERELGIMRQQMLPALVAREYVHDDEWGGPDIEPFYLSGGWA